MSLLDYTFLYLGVAGFFWIMGKIFNAENNFLVFVALKYACIITYLPIIMLIILSWTTPIYIPIYILLLILNFVISRYMGKKMYECA